VLYPAGQDQALVSIAGQRTTSTGMHFEQLLSILDQAALVQMS
jgi:hypothetical protein